MQVQDICQFKVNNNISSDSRALTLLAYKVISIWTLKYTAPLFHIWWKI